MANLLYNYTDVEQARQLVKIGLDPKTSDMYYETVVSQKTGMPYYHTKLGSSPAIQHDLFSFRNGYIIPCWSVGALLKTLPKYELYHPGPRGVDEICISGIGCMAADDGESLVDLLCEMVKYLIEHGFIEPKKY